MTVCELPHVTLGLATSRSIGCRHRRACCRSHDYAFCRQAAFAVFNPDRTSYSILSGWLAFVLRRQRITQRGYSCERLSGAPYSPHVWPCVFRLVRRRFRSRPPQLRKLRRFRESGPRIWLAASIATIKNRRKFSTLHPASWPRPIRQTGL